MIERTVPEGELKINENQTDVDVKTNLYVEVVIRMKSQSTDICTGDENLDKS